MPGGLAEGLQSAVLQRASAGGRRAGLGREERVLVRERRGDAPGGCLLVRGVVGGRVGEDEGEEIGVVLAGKRKELGPERMDGGVQSGKVVVLRGLTWDLEVEGRKWVVGLDWKVDEA